MLSGSCYGSGSTYMQTAACHLIVRMFGLLLSCTLLSQLDSQSTSGLRYMYDVLIRILYCFVTSFVIDLHAPTGV